MFYGINIITKRMSEFKAIIEKPEWSDKLYRFLQVIFHLYPEDKFYHLIASVAREKNSDEAIYREVQRRLPEIKPFLSELTYALPALKKQKKEMALQAMRFLANKKQIDGYLEIGSTGRYISWLRKHIKIAGPIYITNDAAPDFSIQEIFERGQIPKLGRFFPLDYASIGEQTVATASLDLVSCNIGLHHCPDQLLEAYLKSIHRVLRKGGLFIMREHDVKNEGMATFVSLVHTVFNLGLKTTWEKDAAEYKSFRSIDDWSRFICSSGFRELGPRILQANDPSDNTLVAFEKLSA